VINALNDKVTITTGRSTRRRVPFVLAAPSGSAAASAVVMVHGMWSTKEQLLPYMREFAAAGVSAISIDARGHGERRQSWQRAGMDRLRAKGAARFMNLAARLALETADDIVAVCTWLRSRDANVRIALWGVSLGANAVLAATPDAKPTAVAAAYGHADWDLMWKLSWASFHPDKPVPAPLWTLTVRRLLDRLEAMNRTDDFVPAALLLVHGRVDHPMIDGMRSLHKRLAPQYHAHRRRLKFAVNAGGHAFSESDANRMRRWICEWLPPT
jgi:dienelactone hydrolase